MPLIRDDDPERQERIDKLVRELAEMRNSIDTATERVAAIAKQIVILRR
jgi:hypothetical protein